MELKDFGEILKECRLKKGLKQKDVAHLLGFKGTKQIERYEKGTLFPDIAKVYQLVEIYETDFFSLLSPAGGKDTDDSKLDKILLSLSQLSKKISNVETKLDSSNG